MTTAKPTPTLHRAKAMVLLLSLIGPSSLVAFSPSFLLLGHRGARGLIVSSRVSTSPDHVDDDVVVDDSEGYPVRILHQGHSATIFVHRDETILHALERQSLFSSNRRRAIDDDDTGGDLALSHIPHDCRRGNCLTCSSRSIRGCDRRHVYANVNNGLSATVASVLDESGIVLTCCSYVTGPGVILELDTNDDAWDMVHRRRICDNPDTAMLAMEARARLLRRLDERDVGGWKRKLERTWESK
ncbi:hypothetical protein ACHAXA_003310 [Cyclostephanos tholiformis]|uniref:2Fe-2S ferredoxin-type domain-containing protein n=1 Tax=Cyclostephanos tholiformis TaxID=382380 RepID=A0ABD3SBM8_9STRA